MTNMRDLARDVEDTSIKAMKTHDPETEQHLWKLLGDASTNRTAMNDLGAILGSDSNFRKEDPGFPLITVIYSSPDAQDPDRHVVDIQFRVGAGSSSPDLEWGEK